MGDNGSLKINLSPELQSAIAEIAAKQDFVEKIVLFGSRARCDNREKSDIDLAIFINEKEDDLSWVDFYEHMDELPTLLKLDIVRIREGMSPEFVANINREGKTIWKRQK